MQLESEIIIFSVLKQLQHTAGMLEFKYFLHEVMFLYIVWLRAKTNVFHLREQSYHTIHVAADQEL